MTLMLIEFYFKVDSVVFYEFILPRLALFYCDSCCFQSDKRKSCRSKTRFELIKLSLSVCGIELAYACETGELEFANFN